LQVLVISAEIVLNQGRKAAAEALVVTGHAITAGVPDTRPEIVLNQGKKVEVDAAVAEEAAEVEDAAAEEVDAEGAVVTKVLNSPLIKRGSMQFKRYMGSHSCEARLLEKSSTL
jgi:hypothetical protein